MTQQRQDAMLERMLALEKQFRDGCVADAECKDEAEADKDQEANASTKPYDGNRVFFSGVPPEATRDMLKEIFSRVDSLVRVHLSEPAVDRQCVRDGWAEYGSAEACAQAVENLDNAKLERCPGSVFLKLAAQGPAYKRSVAPSVSLEPHRIEKDLQTSLKLCRQLDQERNIQTNALLDAKEGLESLTTLTPLQKLNIAVAYLRHVHYFCYYCARQFVDREELLNKCGPLHHRSHAPLPAPLSGADTEASSWEKHMDVTLYERVLNPPTPTDYMLLEKQYIDAQLEKFFNKNILKQGPSKFRCALCSKLFKGDEFLRKHLSRKHEDSIKALQMRAKDEYYFESYIQSADHVSPPMLATEGAEEYERDAQRDTAGRESRPRDSRRDRDWRDRERGWDRERDFDHRRERGPRDRPRDVREPRHSQPRRDGPMYQGGPSSRGPSSYRAGPAHYHRREAGPPSVNLPMPIPVMPPPLSRDPRRLRSYTDLDAPVEGDVIIDYKLDALPATTPKQ